MTVAETLESGTRELAANSSSPRLDAELLLAQVLGVTRAGLRTQRADGLSGEQQQRFRQLLERRLSGAPVAYLTGMREFWSLPLKISEAVLVPRPETELLVEKALTIRAAGTTARVVDLGTGSGAIALALASERPLWAVTATDVSNEALRVARENARQLKLPQVRFLNGSWYEPLGGERFDIILSNPPYIAADDAALSTLSAEPRLALTPGPSGLESLTPIILGAAAHLSAGGALLVEHGMGQGADVREQLARAGFVDIVTHQDLSERPRVTQGTYHPQH